MCINAKSAKKGDAKNAKPLKLSGQEPLRTLRQTLCELCVENECGRASMRCVLTQRTQSGETQRTRSRSSRRAGRLCGLCVKPFADFALKTNTGEHTMSFNAKNAKKGDAKNAKPCEREERTFADFASSPLRTLR